MLCVYVCVCVCVCARAGVCVCLNQNPETNPTRLNWRHLANVRLKHATRRRIIKYEHGSTARSVKCSSPCSSPADPTPPGAMARWRVEDLDDDVRITPCVDTGQSHDSPPGGNLRPSSYVEVVRMSCLSLGVTRQHVTDVITYLDQSAGPFYCLRFTTYPTTLYSNAYSSSSLIFFLLLLF